MNKSILTVAHNADKKSVRSYAEKMILNSHKRCVVTFTKKDGKLRTMTIVPRAEYNETIGRASTPTGRKIVASKAKNGMVVVQEVIDVGPKTEIQPRTINLNNIVDFKVL